MFDILVAGEINPDLILSGDTIPSFNQVEKLLDSANLVIGSSSVIFSCGASRLGLKVAFVGKCGKDVFGQFMLDEMAKRKIDISNVLLEESNSTGLSVILNKGSDRAILTYPGLIPELRTEDISEILLNQARHLHIASFFMQTELQPGLPQLFKKAQLLGLTTSLDTNYDPSEKWTGLSELLDYTNVFLPNEVELCKLTNTDSIDLAVEQLSNKVETLAIKLGSKGAYGVQKDHKVRIPPINIEVVDTIGAGDSFNAGFLYGYLNRWTLEKSLRTANICGALSTRAAGGTEAQATLDEVMNELS